MYFLFTPMKWIADVTPLRGEKIASLWFPTARKRLHRFLLGENERERLETADQRIFGRRDAVSLNAEFKAGDGFAFRITTNRREKINLTLNLR